MHQLPTRSNVISFLRKRAERAHARYRALDRSEWNGTEVLIYARALTDYSRENFRKATARRAGRPTAEETTEIMSRMQGITGPRKPLPPAKEALVRYAARHPKEFIEWAEEARARKNSEDSDG